MLGVATVVFFVLRLAPGDPAMLLAGPTATPEVIESIRQTYGLDRPLVIQYVTWLRLVAAGNLGESIFTQRPVLDEILDKLQNTAVLALGAFAISTTLGLLLGGLAAARPRSVVDRLCMLASLFGASMPSFWIGLMLIIALSGSLRWFPAQGMVSPAGGGIRDVVWHLVLPAVTLALPAMALVTRLARSALLDVLRQDYVRSARAKGLREARVFWRHALRNALIPIVTVLGAQIGVFLAGAVIVEFIFSWPGLGALIVSGISARDYPLVQGATLFIALIFVLVNLAVDLLYPVIDPRIRYGGRVGDR